MARASYTGRIQAGMVTFGIKAYSVAQPVGEDTRLNTLHAKCGNRIRQQFICPIDDVVVRRDETVRGYEYAKEQYVIITDDDLKSIEPEDEGRVFQLRQTIAREEIDPLWLDKAYYVVPADDEDRRAYALFSRAMRDTDLASVVTFVSHHKHHLAVIWPHEGTMLMQTLHFHDTLRELTEVGTPDTVKNLQVNEIRMAKALLESLQEPFKHQAYKDEFRVALQALVDAKLQHQPLPRGPIATRPVTDLMAALKASLATIEAGKRPKKKK